MANEFTPGPWKMAYKGVDDGSGYAPSREVQFRGSNGDSIGVVMQGRVDDEPRNGNARLIEKAPEMYQVLLMAQDELVTLVARLGQPYRKNVETVMANIKKALPDFRSPLFDVKA